MSQVLGTPKGQSVSYQKRKLEVLRSAAVLFNERGFHNTTMDDIAAILNVTKPALYYYAKSKDELLYEIGSVALNNTNSLLDTIESSQGTGAQKLKKFFAGWTQAVCGEFGRCLVLTKPESLEFNSRKKSKLNRRHIQTRVESFFKEGVHDNSIAKVDVRMATMAMFDLHNGVAYWFDATSENDRSLTPSDIADHYWRLFTAGFRNDAS